MKQNFYSTIRLLSLLALVNLSMHAGAAEKPNVLFIAVDDLNDWVGYFGNSQAITPNMDQLASEGVWFSKAYCQYPVCGPSRASLMSGLYYHQLDSPKLQAKDEFVEQKVQSMGSELLHGYLKKMGGYKTMAVGKILHNHLPKENLDLSGGRGSWDFHRDKKTGQKIKREWKSQKTMTDWGPWEKPEEKMSDSESAAWAVDRLRESHDEPFMLMVGFLRPHVPWYVPQKYFDRYDREAINLPAYKKDDLDDVPAAALETINEGYPRTEWAIENNQWKHIAQSYLASITFADSKVGEVLDALKKSPYYDNTIVILWSDHGYHMGEKNTFQKHTLWERSGLSPLIIKLPPSMQGEKFRGKCDKVVGLIDIYPTLVELCDLPANDKVVGRSLKPLLEDQQTEWNHPTLMYRKDGGKSVRYQQYRYIEYGDGSQELYDHDKDPNEWNNVAKGSEYQSVLEMMKVQLTENHIPPTKILAEEYRIDSQEAFDSLKTKTFKAGDSILFKRGVEFKGMFSPSGKGSPEAPIIIDAYGEGELPVIHAEGRHQAGLLLKNPCFWEVNRLEITNTNGTTEDQGELFGIYVVATEEEGAYEHVYINECYIHDVNAIVSGKKRGGIHVHIQKLKESKFHDLRITGNRIFKVGGVGIGNASPCGDVAVGKKGEYVAKNLWTGVYVADNHVDFTGRNNIIARVSENAVYERNILANSSRADTGHSIFNFDTVGIKIQYNEAYGNIGEGGMDRGGFDADYNSVDTYIQYNYSHDNLWFCGIMKRPNANVIIRYNVSQNDREGIYFYGFENTKNATNIHIYNNTHFVRKGLAGHVIAENRTPLASTFENNIFHFEDKGHWGTNAEGIQTLFDNNIYFNLAPHMSDKNPRLVDPLFVAPGNAGTDIDLSTMKALEGYRLQPGSSAFKEATQIENHGGQNILKETIDDRGQRYGAL